LLPPALATRRPAAVAELAWQRLRRDECDDLATLAPLYITTVGIESST
jgi:hypothetical protein